MESPQTSSHVDLAAELQKIYDSEINIEMSWPWDGDLRLGDRVNGYEAEENVQSIADVLPWFQEAIAHFYPDSTYAKNLDGEVKARAAHRLFRPPTSGARVTCPLCGAPNPNHGRMEEIICFACSHCGATVEIAPPKVQ